MEINMMSGISKASGWQRRLGSSGQMSVELAVVFPVALVMVFIMINTMMFLSACARFDPLAAEAVRSQAASPGAGQYSMATRAGLVEHWLDTNFADYANIEINVEAGEVIYGRLDEAFQQNDTAAIAFALLPRQECFTCTLTFRPWGFPKSFFGLELPAVQHRREFVIDPYRPGVLF